MNVHPASDVRTSVRWRVVAALLLPLLPAFLAAQCTLVCSQNLQISLPETGSFTLTPDLVAPSASNSCPGLLQLTLYNAQGQSLPNANLTCAYVGQTLTARVKHLASGNLCTASIVVNDFLPPSLSCPERMVSCSDDPYATPYPTMSDNCTPNASLVVTVTENQTTLACGATHNGQAVSQRFDRQWQVSDANGNTSSCVEQVWVKRATSASVVFPPNRDGLAAPALSCGQNPSDLALTGQPTIDGQPIDNSGPCGVGITYSDQTVNGCSPQSYTVLRTWTALDFCTSQIVNKTQVIKVLDQTPPLLTAPANLTVGTNETTCAGTVTLPQPLSVSDACSSVAVSVLWQFGSGFGPFNNVPEGDHVVTYRATDACGNSTTQTMTLSVRDNDPPQVICVPTLQVSLGSNGQAIVNTAALDAGSWDNCGPVFLALSRNDSTWAATQTLTCADQSAPVLLTLRVTDVSGLENFCEVEVTVRDFQKPALNCPANLTLTCLQDPTDLNVTGQATAADNCTLQSLVFQDITQLNGCHTGTVTRTWTATDAAANTRSCVQTIALTATSTLAVTWPTDKTLNACGASTATEPSATGQPSVSGASCLPPTVTYTDQIFTVVPPACFRILRTWKVIDHCVYNPNNGASGPGYWEHVQQITVADQQAPVVTAPADVTVSPTLPGCLAQVTLADVTATDCSSAVTISHNSAYATSGPNASGQYPVGTHNVTFTATDGCGNAALYTLKITVQDLTPPSALCFSGLSVNLTQGGVTTLQPALLNAGSTDNCTAANALAFAVEPAFFSCQNLGVQTVTLLVTDAAGNTGSCQTLVNVQDNQQFCVRHKLTGFVRTPQGEPVPDVTLTDGQGHTTATDTAGYYEFDNLLAGLNYTVAPQKDLNWANGVTSYDLVLINRHILGLEPLDSPFKIIAADANKSSTVSAFDIVQLRKIILGVIENVPDGLSWRFVQAGFVFPNAQNPFETAFPETYALPGLDASHNDLDFTAIKTGDLNGTVVPGE